jgi:hypothetical protein
MSTAINSTSLDLADQLNPYVQEKFRALWSLEWPAGRRYVRAWPRESLTKETLDGLLAEGLVIDATRSADASFVFLTTTDPQLAFPLRHAGRERVPRVGSPHSSAMRAGYCPRRTCRTCPDGSSTMTMKSPPRRPM